ncbi:MAG: hypothetical protein KF841_00905 [Phycisphaerae bacterium]|nr:hypothetical protein [Phycisphaerae bacterium]
MTEYSCVRIRKGFVCLALFGVMFLLLASGSMRVVSADDPPKADNATTQPDGRKVEQHDGNADRPPLGGPAVDRPRRPRRDAGSSDDGSADQPRRGRGSRDGREMDRGQGGEGDRDMRERRWMRPPHPDSDEDGGRPPRPGPMGPDGMRERFAPPLPPDVKEALESIIREEMPEFFRRMSEWRERHPERFDRAMGKFYPPLREYVILREHDPALAATVLEDIRLELQLRKLSMEYQSLDESSPRRAELEQAMAERVRRQIDIRLERREARLRMLSEQLERQRIELQTERSRIEEVSAHRLQQIIKEGADDPFFRPDGRGPRIRGDRREPGDRAGDNDRSRHDDEPRWRGPRGQAPRDSDRPTDEE